MIKEVDKVLFLAKNAGRNQVQHTVLQDPSVTNLNLNSAESKS